jgi:hypothetical protein
MIIGFNNQVSPINISAHELLIQVARRRQIPKAVINPILHPFQTYLERWEQDHVVQVGQSGCGYKGRQEPWPKDTVVDHSGDVGQPTGSIVIDGGD